MSKQIMNELAEQPDEELEKIEEQIREREAQIMQVINYCKQDDLEAIFMRQVAFADSKQNELLADSIKREMKVNVSAEEVGKLKAESVESIKRAIETGKLDYKCVSGEVEKFLDKVEGAGESSLPTKYEIMFQNMLKNVRVKFEPVEEESKSGEEKIDEQKSDDELSFSGDSQMSDDLFTQETSQSQDNGPKNVDDSYIFDRDLT